MYFVSSTKNTEGFNSDNTFLKVESLERRPAELTPSNLKDFVKFLKRFLLPLLTDFFLVDITLTDFFTTFAPSFDSPPDLQLGVPGLLEPPEKPSEIHDFS